MSATGRIVQVIGSTFDAEFAEAEIPRIYNAVRVDAPGAAPPVGLTGEVQQHLGDGRVRCLALGQTEGLARGMEVRDTGSPVDPQISAHGFRGLIDSVRLRREIMDDEKAKAFHGR